MKKWLRLPLCILIIQWLSTSAVSAITFDEARHLLSRTSFGGGWGEIQALRHKEYSEAVSQLLDAARTASTVPPPKWVEDRPLLYMNFKYFPRIKRKKMYKQRYSRAMELKAWWFREMIETDSPLTERMTLFWHGHFTSSHRKVKAARLMYDQNQLLRRHALGNFREMTHAVARDPAMIVYLDNVSNVQGKPNENFARELLELFTLGEGHFTERDVKEGARAFTGWSINRKTVEFKFFPKRHDAGSKEFMGRTGSFGGEEIIDIVLEQPRAAIHITEKLWREFVSETPDPGEVSRLASVFRDNNYEIKPLMFALLTSPAFRDRRNYGTMIKSPVEMIVGTMRLFRLLPDSVQGLVLASRKLGQDVMNPPSVKGWAGGNQWITSDTLTVRYGLLDRFSRGREMMHTQKRRSPFLKKELWAETDDMEPFGEGLSSEDIMKVLLPIPPVEPAHEYIDREELVSSLVLDPVYQLK